MGRRKSEDDLSSNLKNFSSNSEISLNKSDPIMRKICSFSTLVNVRDCPGGNILFSVHNHMPVLVESDHDGWCKITGYIRSDLLRDI